MPELVVTIWPRLEFVVTSSAAADAVADDELPPMALLLAEAVLPLETLTDEPEEPQAAAAASTRAAGPASRRVRVRTARIGVVSLPEVGRDGGR